MSDITEENNKSIEQNEEVLPEEEKPFLVTTCKIDGNTQRELSWSILLYCRIAMAVGIPLVIAYIVLSVLKDEEILSAIPNAVLYAILFFGAVLFATGIVFYFTVKKNIKNTEKINQTNEYSFFEDYVLLTSIRLGERLGASKVYYTDFAKVRERKKYFLLYPTSVSILPVPKEGLTEGEIDHLRNALRIIKK